MEEHVDESDYSKFLNTKDIVTRSIVPENKDMPQFNLLNNVLPKMGAEMKRVFVRVNNEDIMFELPNELDKSMIIVSNRKQEQS